VLSLTRALIATTPVDPPVIDENIISETTTGADWVRAGAILVGAIAVAIAVARISRAVLERAIGEGFAAIIVARIIAYTIFVVGLVYSLTSLGVRVGPLLGALGLGGLVLALALQRVAENFVGALILQARRPFTVGDTVDLDGHVGVVTDIDSRTTVLRGLDGSMIRIPNGSVLNTAIVNLTREQYRRSELTVGVAYDSDLHAATRALENAVRRVPRVRRSPSPWVMLRQFGASSIDFSIYYWHRSDVPSELAATHDLLLSVHQGLAAAGITIAFPQMVVWAGHDAVDDPYDEHPDEVFTTRDWTPAPPDHEGEGGTTGFDWRRPWRRRSSARAVRRG